eukprot:TRINITY_DN518_c0_g2_i1.p1 TRINITY_DN518_c0_g2~~TRINITY_DN518_c0_g2_i1.p1  ORF type:complete len:204 (-),score=59.65 TRINITY_DN518_c0_g2_i1:136-726(-)
MMKLILFLFVVLMFVSIKADQCIDGSAPVNCFVNPCDMEDCGDKKCLSNYCGGCNAFCECEQDNECKSDEFCRIVYGEEVNYCSKYSVKGEACNGFVPDQYRGKCNSEQHICYTPPDAPMDVPGICLSICDSSSDCEKDEYCSELEGICLSMGTCMVEKDCQNSDNIYATIMCVGDLVCTEHMCGRSCNGGMDMPL